MFSKPLITTSLLILALAQNSNEEKAKKDLQRMQGTWIMHALEINGKEVPAKQFEDTQLTIKADEYNTKVKDRTPPGFRLKLDPSKDPRAVDMIQTLPDGSQKTIKGIYKVENDTLVICRGLTEEQERPGQFATWPNTNYFVVTWKKQVK